MSYYLLNTMGAFIYWHSECQSALFENSEYITLHMITKVVNGIKLTS